MLPYDSGNKLRVPKSILGLQVNFCKNIDCSNFGAPATSKEQKSDRGNKSEDDYVVKDRNQQRRIVV